MTSEDFDRETRQSRQSTKNMLGTIAVISAVASVVFSILDAMTLSQVGGGIAIVAVLLFYVLPTGGESDD